MNPPEESNLYYSELGMSSTRYATPRHDNAEESFITPEREETSLSNSFIFFSSSVSLSLQEKKSLRPQWSWLKYLCWIIPIIWTSLMYTTQLIVGLKNTMYPDFYILAVYNIVAGVLGMTLVGLQIYDNYYYIKPSDWITEEDLIDVPRSRCYKWGMFLLVTLLDAALFLWTVFGSLWSLHLYGQEIVYQPVLIVFSILNIALQWSKYGTLMFVLKMSLS